MIFIYIMKLRKDYQKKIYKNPNFRSQKPSRAKLKIIVLILLGLGFLYGIFLSDLFYIQDIQFVGFPSQEAVYKNIITQQMSSRRFFVFTQNNLLFFKAKKAEQKLADQLIVKAVVIQKNYMKKSLTITLSEEISDIVWVSQGSGYYVNLDGEVVSEVADDQFLQNKAGDIDIIRHRIVQENLSIIYDIANSEVVIGQRVVQAEMMEIFVHMVKQLSIKIPYEFSYFEYDAEKKTISAVSSEEWKIYFSVDSDIDSQVNNAALILKQKVQDTNTLEYIDVRFGEKVFYK